MKTFRNNKGITLIELMVVLLILSVAMAGLYSAFSVYLKHGNKEYRSAEAEMEHMIATHIIARDLALAGYGLADGNDADKPYDLNGDGVSEFTPRAAMASTGATISIVLTGTALGMETRSSSAWSMISEVSGPSLTFRLWDDARENLQIGDRVIIMDPNTKKIRSEGTTKWLYQYKGQTTPPTTVVGNTVYSSATPGDLFYGMYSTGTGTEASQPYYAVKYYLGGTHLSTCEPSTLNLMRAQSRTTSSSFSASNSSISPVIDCVLSLQVAFGLDTDEKGRVNLWDNGGVEAAKLQTWELNKRLRQIRVYALVQSGPYDKDFTYTNPDPAAGYLGTNKIRVGELTLLAGGTGADVTLNASQQKYRWKVLNFTVTPRNIR